MLNGMSTKMLLVVGCLVSGVVVASEKSGEIALALKQDVATAVVAKQFCDNPGEHAVNILNKHPRYDLAATQPTLFPMAGGDIASIFVYSKGAQDPQSITPTRQAIHSLKWDKEDKKDVLHVTSCGGEKGILVID